MREINKDRSFSLWLDFIERDFLKNRFIELIEDDIINGATSNPSIFANAIKNSKAYIEDLKSLENLSPKEKYEALAIKDIKSGAIALRALYDEGREGYISIEVDPFLANDAKESIKEGKRLFKEINEPNVMIKIPATEAGYEAMEELLSDGINVNATLVFSPLQAKKTIEAMKRGIDKFEQFGGERVNGVISVFVSRFDRLLDPILKEKNLPTSRVGVLNGAAIYNLIESSRVPAVKTLFASTGVKSGQNLEADYYIRELYAPRSINTAPLETIEAYLKNGEEESFKLPIPQDKIDSFFRELEENGINMDEVYNKLLDDGLKAFEEAFKGILDLLS
ncbi:MAG: transaldolase [Epsilonproteobacteria bacterium]|nr:transaldolase [Campylobacterota bacterium]